MNPVVRKRNEVEIKLSEDWINTIDDTPDLQNEATQTMLMLDSIVFDELISEMARDMNLTES